jgi:hypothetical protein
MNNRYEEFTSKEELLNLSKKYNRQADVAKHFNRTSSNISQWTKRYGIREEFLNNLGNKYRGNKYKCDFDVFSEDSERSFYIAGVLSADGNVRYNKGYQTRLSVSYKDIEWLEDIKKAINSDYNIKRSKRGIRTFPNGKSYNCGDLATLSIYSKRIFTDLQRFNIVPNKTKTIKFPEWLKNHKLIHHFMRGLSDGDGTFHCKKNKKSISFGFCGSIDMVTNYNNLLVKNCNLQTTDKKVQIASAIENYATIAYGGNGVCANIFDFLYQDATIFLKRKYLVAKQAKEWRQVIRKNYSKSDIIEAAQKCNSIKEMGYLLKISYRGVYFYAIKFDIQKEVREIVNNNFHTALIAATLKSSIRCNSLKEMAADLDYSLANIICILKKYNIKEEVQRNLKS